MSTEDSLLLLLGFTKRELEHDYGQRRNSSEGRLNEGTEGEKRAYRDQRAK